MSALAKGGHAKRFAAALAPMILVASQGSGATQCLGGAADDGHDHGEYSEIDTRFALIDGTGSVVVSTDLFDMPALVYFGYTFCPDICPYDNARNAEAVDVLAERGLAVRPVFITVDPVRDTPEVMAEYTGMMHPDMVGLTGTVEQIGAVAASFGVHHSSAEPDEEYYLVDHSTFSYLILPGEGVVDRLSRTMSAADLAERVACHVSER